MPLPKRFSTFKEERKLAIGGFIHRSRMLGVFRYRDFRLMWSGAFLSFIGSWIQNVAQGYLVFQLTNSNYLLGLVSFFGMLPVTFLGPVAGTLTDMLDKRKLLVATQTIYAVGAFFLAAASYFHFVQYWHIVAVAIVLGTVSAVEMPTRQSIVSSVVPAEDLPAAIPINALTFNLSRLIGPAIGGGLLSIFGAEACYFLNGISFFAMIFAVLGIKADLRASAREPQPIGDLIAEGALYTFRDKRLRTLFLLEAIVSTFGLFYLTQMAAIAKQMLGVDKQGLGFAYTSVGVGAVFSIAVITQLSNRDFKAVIIRISMTLMGIGLTLLSFVHTQWLAYPLFVLLGMCAIAQFNTTNTLFQVLSPPRLRGRVLAMHIWALSGLSPFGVLGFGYLAERLGLRSAILIGAAVVLAGAVWGWAYQGGLKDLEPAAA